MGKFRWKSWLGASVILYLLYAAANVVAALVVPTTLARGGAGCQWPSQSTQFWPTESPHPKLTSSGAHLLLNGLREA